MLRNRLILPYLGKKDGPNSRLPNPSLSLSPFPQIERQLSSRVPLPQSTINHYFPQFPLFDRP